MVKEAIFNLQKRDNRTSRSLDAHYKTSLLCKRTTFTKFHYRLKVLKIFSVTKFSVTGYSIPKLRCLRIEVFGRIVYGWRGEGRIVGQGGDNDSMDACTLFR